MQELLLDYVEFLSIVDDPAVGDAQFLVTKRHDQDDNAEDTETMTDSDEPESDDEVVMKDAVAELNEQLSTMNDRLDTLESEFGSDDDDIEQDEQNEAVDETAEERYTLSEIQAISEVVDGIDVTPDPAGEPGESDGSSAEPGDTDAASETERKGRAGSGGGNPSTYTKSQSGRKVKDLKNSIEQAQRGDE